jgi:5-methylcytosine-specific restriction endonuclease McrA
METDPRSSLDLSAIYLAEKIVQLLDRGGFSATYKYAVLIALIDLCLERTTATGMPPQTVTTEQVAEKVIELYWLQCAPYDSEHGVLHQSRGGAEKPVLIVRHILEFRATVDPAHERSLSLPQARAKAGADRYKELVRAVEWQLIHMPLPRLQRIGRQEERFLYEYAFTEKTTKGVVSRYQQTGLGFNNKLEFMPGVSAALLALNGVLRPLVFRQWTTMVASMNGIEQSQLEDFLFGAERISLEPVRSGLLDIQGGSCFYCDKPMLAACDIDHFIPWSRHADNSIDNLVAAHGKCNGKKSNYLAAAEHVEKWGLRSQRHAADLAQIAREKTWESQPARTFSVARAIYGMLPDDARLWRAGGVFVPIDRSKIRAALMA